LSPKPADAIPTFAMTHLFQPLQRLFDPSDEQLMWRLQHGNDPAAFDQLVHRWREPVRRLGFRMTGDHHRAEDLAQETFSRIFAKRADYRPDSRFSTFLWRVALNLCHDEFRRQSRRRELSLDEDEPFNEAPEPSPAVQLELSECADSVRHALQRLPEHYRAVVILRHYEGLKLREIAEVLEVPEGTVKSRMAEALDRLAPLLAEFKPVAPARPKAVPVL
jgi:RNA polymerase sigma-70 factor (ECF subfamily)